MEVASKTELVRKGAQFVAYGDDQEYAAVLSIDGKKFYFQKSADDEYRLMDQMI